MAAYLFTGPRFRPLTLAGAIMPGAKLQLYLTGTTTPTPGYSNAGLSAALSDPIVADASGEFPAIYLSTLITYRAQLYNSADVLQWDVDPLS